MDVKTLLTKVFLIGISIGVLFWIVWSALSTDNDEPKELVTSREEVAQEIHVEKFETHKGVVEERESVSEKPAESEEMDYVGKVVNKVQQCMDKLDETYSTELLNNSIQEKMAIDNNYPAGSSYYQSIPKETLKSLADSGDPKAMMAYGIELAWYASIGLYIGDFGGRYQQPKDIRAVIEEHESDFVMFAESQQYLYRAALHGKELALGEALILSILFREQYEKKGGSLEQIETLYAQEAILLKLAEASFTKDFLAIPALINSGHGKSVWDSYEETLNSFGVTENEITKRVLQLQENTDKLFEEKLEQWMHDRESIGMPHFSDHFTDYEEELLKNQLECYL